MKKGRMVYVPPMVLDEVEDIKREDRINKNSNAFRELVRYSQVGREAKRIIKFDWSRKAVKVTRERERPIKKGYKKNKKDVWRMF